MAKLDPTVFNRLRRTTDDFTDAAYKLVRQLDAEIERANGSIKDELRQCRNLVNALGYQFDSFDPDGGDPSEAWGIAPTCP
jgi:hypothetical protein